MEALTTADEKEWLYVIRAVRPEMVSEGPDAREEETLARHAEYLGDLTARGTVLLFGRTQNRDPSGFGLVVFRTGSRVEAERVMENDPAVKEGLMRAELYPYRVAGWRGEPTRT